MMLKKHTDELREVFEDMARLFRDNAKPDAWEAGGPVDKIIALCGEAITRLGDLDTECEAEACGIVSNVDGESFEDITCDLRNEVRWLVRLVDTLHKDSGNDSDVHSLRRGVISLVKLTDQVSNLTVGRHDQH